MAARLDDLTEALHAVVGRGRVRAGAPLGPLTTLRVGGRADWIVDARTERELSGVLGVARRADLPVTVLGGGSNVLVSDAGVRGVVLRPRGATISQPAPGIVRAEAGVRLNGLIRWMIRRGLAGLEAWAGTPGAVGGAVCGNAHFGGRSIGEVVTAAGVCGPGARIVRASRKALGFGYGRSRLQATGEVLAWAEFAATEADPGALRAVARRSLSYRKATQPLSRPSAGCVFRNPPPDPDSRRDRVPPGTPRAAGALIDRAGLKGSAIGGARVSSTHANFILTREGARAADVLALIDRCRRAVSARYDVDLIPEIALLGEFDESASFASNSGPGR